MISRELTTVKRLCTNLYNISRGTSSNIWRTEMDSHTDKTRPTPPPQHRCNHWEQFIGRKIGNYEIVEFISKGGMGMVFRAHDKSLDRDVALKILRLDSPHDRELEKRFIQEARGTARFDHPNIVQVYSAGRCEDVLFIAMQFIEGVTLSQLIKEKGRLDPIDALTITLQVAEALEAAHKIRLIHRDIKPNNIMLDEEGRIKVMDFGLSRFVTDRRRMTHPRIYIGTPEYSSPEQCSLNPLDERTDIYSLGVVLYQMLTGRVPYLAQTTNELFDKIKVQTPIPVRDLDPRIPKGVAHLVERMMAKEKEERFASATELKNEILGLLQGLMKKEQDKKTLLRRIFNWKRSLVAAILIFVILGIVALRGSKRPVPSSDTIHTPVPSVRLLLAVIDGNSTEPEDPKDQELTKILFSTFMDALAKYSFIRLPSEEEVLREIRQRRTGQSDAIVPAYSEIARALKADFWVEGMWWGVGDEIWISIKLYRDNQPILSTYRHGRKSASFNLIEELAGAIAERLKTFKLEQKIDTDRDERLESIM